MLKALNSPTKDRGNDIAGFVKAEVDTMSNAESSGSSKKSLDNFTPSESAGSVITKEAKHRNDSLEEIYTWLDQMSFSRTRKNIARDFSDGVFMAELLKRYYPRHVDLHNYVSRSSVANKIDNWSTLNRKVLAKIGMKLGKDMILRLAYSEPGAIETVLVGLRAKILKDCNDERASLYFDYEDHNKEAILRYLLKNLETVKSVLNSDEVANKTVPREAFVKLKHELQEKKSVISTLSEKVSHLESLMKLKDQRIVDLTTQITGLTEKNTTPRSNAILMDNSRKN